ncbi:glycosyltransferase family 4 protein [Candidatus Borrarchaeum sp.]|uniref:glycosyltransferase family 4 protein n=1 Tax=Candidatus Borrarchaeum sp. TaxID=2846742 RepID=UPI00257EC142|nr:glycosyltransferase family 4 protein [Candidatus Borrarchaeum sp.]
MKILYASDYFYPHMIGGVEEHIYQLAKHFLHDNFQIAILTRQIEKLPSLENYEGIKIYRYRPKLHPQLSKFFIDPYSIKKTSKLINKITPNIFHAQSIPFMSLAPLYVAIQKKIPAVLTLHNYWPVCFFQRSYFDNHICNAVDETACKNCFSSYLPLIGKPFLTPILWKLWKRSLMIKREVFDRIRAITTPSHALKKSLARIDIPLSKVLVIPNGIDLNKFIPDLNAMDFIKHFKLEKQKIILSIGRLIKEKGIRLLIKSMPIILKEIDCKLVIVGGGEEKPFLTQLVKKLKIERHVIFAGRIPSVLVPQAYSAADVVVVPSIWPDPFPYVPLEALAMKTPVIASNVGGLPEVVRHKKNGLLVRPYNVEELANAAQDILSDEHQAQQMGSEGRIIVEKEYTLSLMLERYKQLYSSLVK